MTKKAVRNSKAGTLPARQEAKPEDNHKKMQVSQGNVGLVTTSLLNAQNNNLAAILEILERLEQKLNG